MDEATRSGTERHLQSSDWVLRLYTRGSALSTAITAGIAWQSTYFRPLYRLSNARAQAATRSDIPKYFR